MNCTIMLLIIAIGFILFFICLYLISPLIAPTPLQLSGAHVVVTGGSSGIGRAIAIEVARRGANVTLLARNQEKLTEATTLIESQRKDVKKQVVVNYSVDLSKNYQAVENAINQAQKTLGPVDMLVNCAGLSISGKFEEIPLEEFKHLLDVNYLGSVYATRASLPQMKTRNSGRIVFVSSQAGQLGVFGFTAYSASKFALRGLAESLQMEVKTHNIQVSLAFPPDTDTAGYAHEMKTKPKECRLISDTSGLFQPAYVAKRIVNDALVGKFLCHIGLDGYMLSMLTCGMSPVNSITEATQQVLSMGLFRAISLLYLRSFDRIVYRCKREEDERHLKST